MKNWIWKFAAALGMTVIIVVFWLAIYTGINYLTKTPNSEVAFSTLLSLVAIYLYCRDYAEKMWE